MSEVKKFSGWAVVELMGHVRVAGMVTEETVAGVALLRVDCPEVEHHPAFTRYYHPNALYSLCPTDEATARLVAKTNRHPPLEPWQMPRTKETPAAISNEPPFEQDWGDERDLYD
jgi:hypothetical protein